MAHGVQKLRLTGGEPLLRKNLDVLIEQLSALRTPEGKPLDLTLTTPGSLLRRKAAGLKDVRMHDLRHSFASFLVNSGRTLYEVQQLLGHTQIKTTARYSHLSQDTLLDASNAVTRAVGHLFMPRVPATNPPLLSQ